MENNTIFVYLISCDDHGLRRTLDDLFDKATEAERISVGVARYIAGGDTEFMYDARIAQVRVVTFTHDDEHGICRARSEAQKLWRGEEYVLSLEGSFLFAQGWDDGLIFDLAECKSAKSVLSNLPNSATAEEIVTVEQIPSVVTPGVFDAHGAIQMRYSALSRCTPEPLRGAFVVPGYVFAKKSMLQDVPSDPAIHGIFESISLAVRLFTHGYDVYSTTQCFVFCTKDSGPENAHLRKMTDGDGEKNDLFIEKSALRWQTILGVASGEHPLEQPELAGYRLGTERSVHEFAERTQLDPGACRVTEWSQRGGFIEDLAMNRLIMIFVPEYDRYECAPIPPKTYPERVLAAPNRLLKSLPSARARLQDDVPPGVFVVHEYLDEEACHMIRAYADAQIGEETIANDKNVIFNQLIDVEVRKVVHVAIDGLVVEMMAIFNDIYCNRVANFYDVDIEWYQRPTIFRYPIGGKYMQHCDCELWLADKLTWQRAVDRDYSVVLYLNDEFTGGRIEFPHLGFSLTPQRGMLLAFPSDHRFLHTVLPVESGVRYSVASWGTVFGTPRTNKPLTNHAIYMLQQRQAIAQPAFT